MKTIPFRIPVADYKEFKKIAKEYDVGVGAAYKIWKKKNGLNIKWG